MLFDHKLGRPHQPAKFDPLWIEFFSRPCPYMVKQYTTFPQFPRLPKEIQRIIWSFAIPDPRVVMISEYKPNIDGVENGGVRCQVLADVPGILHACYESRQAGLKIFSAVFRNVVGHPIYFNNESDILYFQDDDARQLFILKHYLSNNPHNTSDLESVRYIAYRQDTKTTLESQLFFFTWFKQLSHLLVEGPYHDHPLPSTIPYVIWSPMLPSSLWSKFEAKANSIMRRYLNKIFRITGVSFDTSHYQVSNWKPPIITIGSRGDWANLREKNGSIGWMIGKEETWGTIKRKQAEHEVMDWEVSWSSASLAYKPVYN